MRTTEPATMTYPCLSGAPQAPALYTYYAIMSLLVVTLAVSLIWIPFVQLIAELNIIVAKVLIYMDRELLGSNLYWLTNLGVFFSSQTALVTICIACLVFMMYLASGDFLIFAGCYVCNLPNHKCLENVKRTALGVIEYLLILTGRRRYVSFNGNLTVKYYDPTSKPGSPVLHTIRQAK